jgi:hypothetical protein
MPNKHLLRDGQRRDSCSGRLDHRGGQPEGLLSDRPTLIVE